MKSLALCMIMFLTSCSDNTEGIWKITDTKGGIAYTHNIVIGKITGQLLIDDPTAPNTYATLTDTKFILERIR